MIRSITRPAPPEGYEWIYVASNEKCKDCDLEPGGCNCQKALCDQPHHGGYRLTHNIPWHHTAVLKERRKHERGEGFMA